MTISYGTGGPLGDSPTQDVTSGVDASLATGNVTVASQGFTSLSEVDFNLEPFEKMVEESFPNPEIIKINFKTSEDKKELEEVSVKVQVTGNFLDDEWFWADFLKYFTLEVFLIADLDGQNKDFYNVSLFDSDGRNLIFPVKDPGPSSVSSRYSITSLSNASNKLSNTYVFEGTCGASDKFTKTLSTTKAAIVARTRFDRALFSKEMLEKNAINAKDFSPLYSKNNGRWDIVEFVKSPVITKVERLYAEFESEPRRWNGAFSPDLTTGGGQFYATGDFVSKMFLSGGRENIKTPRLNWKREKYNKSNADLNKAYILMVRFVDKQNDIEVSLEDPSTNRSSLVNNNLIRKFPVEENFSMAFSNLYVAEKSDGSVNLFFSFDYFGLFKQLSTIPNSIFDNLERDYTNPLFTNINIHDKQASKLKKGKYQYLLHFRVLDETDKFIRNVVKDLDKAVGFLESFLKQVKNKEAYNADTKELSESFLESQDGSFGVGLVERAIDIFYNIVESDLLQNFSIQRFKIERRRIKNDLNQIEFDKESFDDVVLSFNPNTAVIESNGDQLYKEFNPSDVSYEPTLLYTRQDLKDSFSADGITEEEVLEFQKILQMFKKNMLSLIDEEKTPAAQANQKSGKLGNTDAIVDYKIKFPQIYDAEKVRNNPTINPLIDDTNTISTLGDLGSSTSATLEDSYFVDIGGGSGLSLKPVGSPINSTSAQNNFKSLTIEQGLDFNFIGSLSPLGTTSKETTSIETLDVDEKKYTVTQENKVSTIIEKKATKSLFSDLSKKPSPPEVKFSYLAGYNKDKNGRPVMKDPIFLPLSEMPQSDKGKEHLIQAQSDEKGTAVATYNEYFIKKV